MSKSIVAEERYRFLDVFRLANYNRPMLAMLGGGALLLAWIYHFMYPSYTVRGYLLIDTQADKASLQNLLGSLGGAGERSSFSGDVEEEKMVMALNGATFDEVYLHLVKSGDDFKKIEKGIERPTDPLHQLGTWVARMRGLSVSEVEQRKIPRGRVSIRKKGILELRLTASTPEAAVYLGNRYLDGAVQLLSAQSGRKVSQARDYIQKKVDELVSQLTTNDGSILSRTKKNLSLLAPQETVAESLGKLKQALQENELQKEQNTQIIARYREKLGSSVNSDPVGSLVGIRRTISDLEEENRILDIRIATLRNGIEGYLKSNKSLMGEGQALADLKRKKELNLLIFENLIKAQLEIDVKGLSILGAVFPLEYLKLDHVSSTMSLFSKSLVAVIFGLLGGFVFLGFGQLINPVVRSKDDVKFKGVSSLGALPTAGRALIDSHAGLKLCQFDSETHETAAFRQIRARLIHFAKNSGTQERKLISILSHGHGEGKSFISLNLAACIAHTEARTVLVDFDLRRASLTTGFGLMGRPGVVDFIEGKGDLESFIIKGAAAGLDFIPAGNLNPQTLERLSRSRFDELKNWLSARYDFVVFDTAPLVVAHECRLVVQETDFAILVMSSWKTRMKHVRDAIEQMKEVRKSHIHFILNRSTDEAHSQADGYYYLNLRKKSPRAVAVADAMLEEPSRAYQEISRGAGRAPTLDN